MKITLETTEDENKKIDEIKEAFNVLFKELTNLGFNGELEWLRKPLQQKKLSTKLFNQDLKEQNMKNNEKDPIIERIEKGEAGIVYFHDIDMQIDILKSSIEELEDAKKSGCSKILVSAWHSKEGTAYISNLIPKKNWNDFYQEFSDRILGN